ncbi:pectate lyase superfamily protein-domain-containing protein [Astrocystis sublimbata]|nr:pectate lyase superfamily protein-domain-containing protein [Astrocystis sublimbata]
MVHGQSPFAPSGYPIWRNVMDFGAKGDGVTDDTAAINAAILAGGRCGLGCGSTTVLGAIVYFPAGTYMVSKPLIQYYYTQFIGDPTASPLPTIKGMATFAGIALIDTDVYIPGGNGSEWYVNQNQFYRQIRNLAIDLTEMPNENQSGDQTFVPTGIHWQVAQSTSIQNVNIKMPQGGGTTAVGIFTENGSGGFMSDITFFGGNIGMRVGSQQFTARGLTFTSQSTAVSMIWDWGWTWQNIVVNSAFIAFDCTAFGGPVNGAQIQGTGSLTVLDSHFSSVPFAITVGPTIQPAITIDNLLVDGNTPSIVLVSGGATILPGTTGAPLTINSWASGRRYTDSAAGTGISTSDFLTPVPNKPSSMLSSSGQWFTRSKPQYETLTAGDIVSVATFGAVGDGVTDSTTALNNAFTFGAARNQVVFIPAGVYMVSSTIVMPMGTRVVGELWSQIMAFGDNFNNPNSPLPMVQVGNVGDVGNIEISDILFTVQAPAAGTLLVQWNVKASSPGSAGMWDSHVRVGGAVGSNMQVGQCPAGDGYSSACAGASMLMHVLPTASGYFENTWFWVADHDLDIPDQSQINVFSARGILVESRGPTWFWGSASEHSALYQYQLANASNIFLGHMQTESPYYQPTPDALDHFTSAGVFESDPTFSDCFGNEQCLSSWALIMSRVQDIFIYGAGFYSFFSSYSQACLLGEECQQRLIQTDFSQGIWLYSLFTKGATESVSPLGGIAPVEQADNKNGFLTAISAWLPLALTGANIGGITVPSDNPTPDNLPPISNVNLTNACGTITCASAIAALPTSGANNNPPGPADCGETCDIFRLLTGTCCGTGGSACFGIELPPGGGIPAPFPITSGFPPPPGVTITASGFDTAGNPTTTTYDSDHTPIVPILLPPGPVPIPPLGPPLLVPPPGELPDDPSYFLIIVDEFDNDPSDWGDSDPALGNPSGTEPSGPSSTTTTPVTSPTGVQEPGQRIPEGRQLFVRTAANQCGNGGATDALALQSSPDTIGTTWCLADSIVRWSWGVGGCTRESAGVLVQRLCQVSR